MSFLEDILLLTRSYGLDLLNAVGLTLELTAVGFAIGLALGLLIAIGRTYGPLPVRAVLAAYIEIVRGTPMLVQLFFIYYATPSLGIMMDPLTASIVAIGLNSAAYQAEYFRMAFNTVQRGQWEAALSIGLSKWGAIRDVVLPQAVRIVIPALTNEAIYLLKYSSIAYFVTVPELVYVSKIIGARTLLYIQIYTISAAFYITVATLLLKLTKTVENRVAIPGLVIKGRI